LGKEDFEQKQKDFAGAGGFAIEYLDGTTFTYGVGDPNNPQSEWLVSCTQKEYKERNEKGGQNYVLRGQMSITQIYHIGTIIIGN